MRRPMSHRLLAVDELDCGAARTEGHTDTALRIASIFVILAGSLFGALAPILARRTRWLSSRLHPAVFETAKYFGSGVIIATSLIHLLGPAIDALGSPCLPPAWGEYPYALGICLISIFLIFILELIAFRWGTAKLARLGLTHDVHGHGLASHAAHGPETDPAAQAQATAPSSSHDSPVASKVIEEKEVEGSHGHHHHHHHHHHHTARPHFPHTHSEADVEAGALERPHEHSHAVGDHTAAQIVGVAILEFGVVLHSVLIGLTLAVTEDFKILFVVLVFHQTFEGLGVGARLAHIRLPSHYMHVPVIGALLFGVTTPIGIAIGLGVRESYSPEGATASIVSGVLDAFSSGILLYTGLVELMAHEFLFNADMLHGSNGKLAYALFCMILGAGLMALLGRWA